MADWKYLTDAEAAMVVNRVGEEHWMFLDMKTRDELIVSGQRGGYRGTVIQAGYAPERRSDLH